MLQTFRATLRGDSLEWGEEVQQLLKDTRPVQVLVTILEEEPIAPTSGRGQGMAEVLEKPETIKLRLKSRFSQLPKDKSLALELIAERREEAKREEAE